VNDTEVELLDEPLLLDLEVRHAQRDVVALQ
jgi:hypothetical protein